MLPGWWRRLYLLLSRRVLLLVLLLLVPRRKLALCSRGRWLALSGCGLSGRRLVARARLVLRLCATGGVECSVGDPLVSEVKY